MPKLLYLITEDWWFCRHFLPMAKAAQIAGFDVAIAARIRDHGEQIAGLGYRVLPLENERRSLGPTEAITSVVRMTRILRAEKPDIVHCIGLRLVLLGGCAARLAGTKTTVLAPTGLGHLWVANGLAERLLRPIVRWCVGAALKGHRTWYLFENKDDPAVFGLDLARDRVSLVGGAGVDPQEFQQSAAPAAPPVKIAVVSRMLKPKGIAEAIAATRRARAQGALVELHLYGATDPSNRTSLTESELRELSAEPGVVWHGATADVARIWRDHHIALLLSWREGLPRALVEAAACGRPIVATDVPGCREVVRDGVEGLLVPLGDIEAAARAIVRLAADPDLRARMGKAAHARFMALFTEQAVVERVQELYREASGVPR